MLARGAPVCVLELIMNGKAFDMRPIVFTLPPQSMAPKRARTAAAAAGSSSSSQSVGATKLTLYGGVPHHPSLAGLWREERLTDRLRG